MNMKEVLISIGLNREYLANPAFDVIIHDIEKVLNQMHINEIKPFDNSIYFEFGGLNINISIENGNIKYLLDKYHEEIIEVITTIDKKEITIQSNLGILSNANCPLNKCNIINSASKEEYNQYGIMMKKDYKLYKPKLVNNHQNNLSLIEILQTSREAFDEDSTHYHNYIYREVAQRKQFDIARVYIEDRVKHKEYSSEILLNNNYQKMNINIQDYGEKEIKPLSIKQIDELISKEKNPKVQEGLRKLSKTRDSYEYKSLKDPQFKSRGFGYSREFFKYHRQKIMKLSVVILVALLSIVYAVFTSNLNINGTGTNRKSQWDIHFDNLSLQSKSDTVTINTEPTIQSNRTTIEEYDVTMATPGDTISYTFDIVNDGDYDATLTSLVVGPVKCSVNGNESDQSAVNVCKHMSYTLKDINNQTITANNFSLASKESKKLKLTLTYEEFNDSNDLPTSNVNISNLGVDLVFEGSTEAKTNSDGSTPKYRTYAVGEEVTVQNEKYNVIGQGDDYVTLLKQQVLTVDEVNTYGGVGTENNHINKNTSESVGTAYDWEDINHTGGMAYYSSPTCGYVNGSWAGTDGCTTEYNESDVKYVVDAWAADKFTNELKTVNGYSARLVEKEELRTQFYPSCSSTATDCDSEWGITPNWLRSIKGDYWTMSQWNNSSTSVWGVAGSRLTGSNIGNYMDTVRPVINVYKSKL